MLTTSNYWNSCLYPLALSSLNSCTYSSLNNQDLFDELDNLAIRAINKFKFSKVALDYAYDSDIENPEAQIEQQHTKGYYFVNNITTKEVNVIVAWMKVFWVEYQLSKERNYVNTFADKNITAFSTGNLLSSIEKAYRAVWDYAKEEEMDYSRVNSNGRPTLGDVNVDN